MGRRIGLLSDIHGNLTALRAVLTDAAGRVDDYWVLGDVLLPGPGAGEILAELATVGATCVRGNWDDEALAVLRGEADMNDPTDVYFTCLVRFLYERIGDVGVTQMAAWPVTLTMTVESVTVALSHNLPTKLHGHDLLPQADQANFDRLFEGNSADVAVIGHTHQQMLRYGCGEQLVVNPGTVGAPYDRGKRGDLRARYAVMTIDGRSVSGVEFRTVDYDVAREVEYARAVGLPYVEFYRDALEAGVYHTHDQAGLTEINARLGYDAVARAFIETRRAGVEPRGATA
jgi:putative phosphoesterase